MDNGWVKNMNWSVKNTKKKKGFSCKFSWVFFHASATKHFSKIKWEGRPAATSSIVTHIKILQLKF